MNITFNRGKVVVSLLAIVLSLVLFFEIAERKNSFVKAWLYEADAANELMVATVAMTPDKDPLVSREKIRGFIVDIKATHPDIGLVVFGEVIPGWYRAPTEEYHQRIAEELSGDTPTLMASLAAEHGLNISFGMAERDGADVFNSQLFVDATGTITNVQRKQRLKSPFFSPGPEPIAFVDVGGVKVGVVICYDMRWAQTIKKAWDQKADLIILSNSDYIDEWDDIRFGYQYLAKQYGAWIVAANRYGNEYETYWDGHIEIMGPFGDIEKSGEHKEQFLVHTLQLNPGQSGVRRLMQSLYTKASIGYLILRHPKIALSYL